VAEEAAWAASGFYPRYPGASWATARFIVNLEIASFGLADPHVANTDGQCKWTGSLEISSPNADAFAAERQRRHRIPSTSPTARTPLTCI